VRLLLQEPGCFGDASGHAAAQAAPPLRVQIFCLHWFGTPCLETPQDTSIINVYPSPRVTIRLRRKSEGLTNESSSCPPDPYEAAQYPPIWPKRRQTNLNFLPTVLGLNWESLALFCLATPFHEEFRTLELSPHNFLLTLSIALRHIFACTHHSYAPDLSIDI